MVKVNNMLEKILSSRTRAEIFRLLFGTIQTELHGREIQRRSGLAIGTVRQELQKLEKLDLVTSRPDSNRLYYQANRKHPIYSDIHNLVLKTGGLVEVLRNVLPASKIQLAFVFGSVAQGKEDAESDVDLMVIGKIGFRELAQYLSGVSNAIGREINPYSMTEVDLTSRIKGGEHFVSRMMEAPKLFVIGSEDELADLGR